MDIIINSLYKDKEIFLRELISNASDALDKIRFLAVSSPALLGEGKTRDLEIRLSFDKDAKTLTITDTGIGMTKDDLIGNLGTIAKSGTTNFLEAMTSGSDLNLIGQFGVGFYSSYLVADKVTVVSKHNDDKQWVWESTADSSFSIAEDPRGNTLGRGTQITLHLKEDATEFLDGEHLKTLVRKYSEFINFPIFIKVSKTVSKEVPVEDDEVKEETTEDKKDDVDVKEDDEEKDEEEKPKTKTVQETVWENEVINSNKAIWVRSKDDISEEEYQKFYKAISKDTVDALSYSHFSAEGEVEFKALLFIPSVAPWDLFENYYGKSSSLKLYVRRVMITDQFEDLMPRYLNFIKGVVDSDDLPVNVSREQLQQHKVLKVIGKKLVRKALEMIKKIAEPEDDDEEEEEEGTEEEKKAAAEKKLADKEEKYNKFWKHFGKNIKMGIIEDTSNRSKLAKLLRFATTKSGDKVIALDDYIKNMKEGQETIHYIAGESKEILEKSPLLQALKKRDFEVLLLTDPVDEYTMQHLTEYEGKKFQSVTKEGIKFGDESKKDKARDKALQEKYKPLLEWWKTVLGNEVEKVILSKRLTDDPCVIVTGQYGYSANMERIMKAQAFANNDKNGATAMASKKTLEVNPNHPVVKSLLDKAVSDAENEQAKDQAFLLFDTALINSGFTMEDTTDFAARMNRMLKAIMGIHADAAVEEVEVEIEEEPEEKKDEAEEEEKKEEL